MAGSAAVSRWCPSRANDARATAFDFDVVRATISTHVAPRLGSMRALLLNVALMAALILAGCSDSAKDTKAEKGEVGEKGDPGPAGPPGPKGDPGASGSAFRVVAPQSSSASCEADEIMISAYCTGTWTNYPLVPLSNGARCGNNPNSTTLRVTIVCAKR